MVGVDIGETRVGQGLGGMSVKVLQMVGRRQPESVEGGV